MYVIDFDLIGILTRLPPQNDHQNLNFVKDIYVVGKKMARNGCKMAKRKSCQFFSEQALPCLFDGQINHSGQLPHLTQMTQQS